MLKTIKKLAVRSKGKDKAVSKLPSRAYARLVVILNGLKAKSIPMNKVIDLAKLRINGKAFSDLISSRPAIGITTRQGLRKAGFVCECVKALPNKKLWTSIKISKA